MSERTFDDFDKHANDYRSTHSENVKITGEDSSFFAEYKVHLLKDYETDKKLKLLDFGCGDGLTETFIENMFPSFSNTGIDVSEKSIANARSRILKKTVFFHFDGNKIPMENDSFDIVFIAAVFHHISFERHADIMNEIYRVMKIGGRIYFFEHNPLNPATRYLVKTCVFDKDARLLPHRYSKKLFVKSEFRNIQVRFILFFPKWKWISFLWRFEKRLDAIPFGAQYLLTAMK